MEIMMGKTRYKSFKLDEAVPRAIHLMEIRSFKKHET